MSAILNLFADNRKDSDEGQKRLELAGFRVRQQAVRSFVVFLFLFGNCFRLPFFSILLHFFGSSSDLSPKKRREQCVLDDGSIQLAAVPVSCAPACIFAFFFLFVGCVHVVLCVPYCCSSYLWPYAS